MSVLTPVFGAAATASWPRSRSLVTSFDPMSPVPPMMTSFMIDVPSVLLTLLDGRQNRRPFFFAWNTRYLAGAVWLAFRLTRCTSSGPS